MNPPKTSNEKSAEPSTSSPKQSQSEQPLKPILKCSRHSLQALRTKRALSLPPTKGPSRRLSPSMSCDTTICFVLSRRASLETPVCYSMSSYSNTELFWVMSSPPPQLHSSQHVSRMPRVAASEYMQFAPSRRASTGSLIHMFTPPLIYTFSYTDITSVSWVTTNLPPLVTVNASSSEPMIVCPVHGTIIADAPPVIFGHAAPRQEALSTAPSEPPKSSSATTTAF